MVFTILTEALQIVVLPCEGVETVKAETEANKLTVVGKLDPTKLRDNLANKTKKKVDLISPQPKKDNNTTNNNKDSKADNKKSDANSEKKTDDKKSKEVHFIHPLMVPYIFLWHPATIFYCFLWVQSLSLLSRSLSLSIIFFFNV